MKIPARLMLTLDSLMGRRFPTLLGLGVLVVGLIGGVLLVGQGTGGFLPRASAEHTPQQVRITNITENGFSVSFTTQSAAIGSIQYGTDENSLNQDVRDDRDQLSGQGGAYQTHHITVRNLQPQTQYYFQIVTQSRQVFENNGQAFAVRTARAVEPGAARSAYGTILNQAGNPATGALIYLTTNGGSPLSGYVKSDGSWSIPLAQFRTQDLSSLLPITDDTSLSVQVVGVGPAEVLNFSIPVQSVAPVETLQFGSPVPQFSTTTTTTSSTTDTTLGNSDTQTDTSAESQGTDIDDTVPGGFTNLISEEDQFSVLTPGEITIRFPSEEAETVSSVRPELSGVAPPGAVLQIEVHSEGPYYGVVKSDDQGNWSWTPPGDLDPGEHTITVTYTDENGQQQRTTRTFTILADSSLPSFVSTPSGQIASPVPSPRPSPVPSPRPSPVPSPLPSPIPTPTASASATGSLPVSGSTLPMIAIGVGAAALLGLGKYARRWIPERR